jgi:hypothetical protein
MNNGTTVESEGNIYAHFFPSTMPIEGEVQFVTNDDAPLQVGMFERNTGYEVPAHTHLPRNIDLKHVGEFLLIQSGSALIKVFNESWDVLNETTVTAGDCVVFLRGGHELTMLEPTRILEVKQGPYPTTANEKSFRDPQ